MKPVFKNIMLLAVVPLLSGCGGGGGLAALGLGSLFGLGGSNSFSSLLGGGSLALLNSPETIPTLVNPEPTSMLLMGTGVAAMAYFKKKRFSISVIIASFTSLGRRIMFA
jgi:hypothetical protein